jgi:isocitrate lyase
MKPGTDVAIARARAYAPYADLIWMETAMPILSQAKEFADGVHAAFPGKMLAYNLSPSFNWDAAGMSEAEMESYTGDLGKLGFTWMFITLAGFHSNGLVTHNFVQVLLHHSHWRHACAARLCRWLHPSSSRRAQEYAKRGMAAYNQLIQREERRQGTPVLTHQTWSGAELMDKQARHTPIHLRSMHLSMPPAHLSADEPRVGRLLVHERDGQGRHREAV